jgi:hypothetical protein
MKLLFTLIFLLSYFFISAQSFFVPGYIILKDQRDTLKGYLDDQDWKIHPKRITFRMGDSNEITFRINELKAFGIQNKEHFRIEKVNLDVSPVDISFLKKTPNLSVYKDTTIALKVILDARISLLSYYSSGLKNHFFYNKDQETKELIDHHYLSEKKYVISVVHNKMYLTQLKLLFSDCPEITNFRNLNFDANSLKKFFFEYNKCLGSEKLATDYTINEKSRVSVGINIGASQTIQNVNSYNILAKTQTYNRRLYMSPIFGPSVNIYSKRNWGKIFLTLEMLLQNNYIKYSESGTSYSWTNLHFSSILRRSYKMKSSFNPFWGAGLNFTRNLGLKSLEKSTTIYNLSDFGSIKLLFDNGFEFGKILVSVRVNLNLQNDHSLVKLQDKIANFDYELEHYPFILGSSFLLTYKFK